MDGSARIWFTPQQRAELRKRWKNGQCVADIRTRTGHSINSSAMLSKPEETVSPSALAVFMSMTNSNLVGCIPNQTGRQINEELHPLCGSPPPQRYRPPVRLEY